MNINIIEGRHNRKVAGIEDTGAVLLQYNKVLLTELKMLTSSFTVYPKQRVLVVVPDEGQEFEIEVWDIKEGLTGAVDDTDTTYTISELSGVNEESVCYLLDNDYAVVDDSVTGSSTVVFSGNTAAHSKIGFKQVIKGVKGLISMPVLLDRVVVKQVSGTREVEIYLFEEEGE